MPIFKATIEVCLECEDFPTACDYLSESLRDELMSINPILNDWQYARKQNGVISQPEEITTDQALDIFSEYGQY